MLDSLDTLIAFALIFTVVSLLITIIVQMIAAAANLRGKNLAWGIAEAFEAIAPNLKAEVGGAGKKLADYCLRDSLISDFQIGNTVKAASAARADEIFDLLHRIAAGTRGGPNAPQADAEALFTKLGVVGKLTDEETQKLQTLKTDVEAKLAALPAGPAKDALQKILTDTTNQLSGALDFAARWALQTADQIKSIYQAFEYCFDTGQERAQEWFTTHARIITMVLGVIFAFALQLDTIEIFKLVSTNRAVRDKLVAQTSKVLAQADKALGSDDQVLNNALAQWKKGLKQKVQEAVAGVIVTTGETREKLQDHAEQALKALSTADSKTLPDADKTAALKDLDNDITAAVKAQLEHSTGDYKLAKADLDGTGFQLFPDGGYRWPNESCGYARHLFGMLLSALLLSLGAPFWFNTLKSLASLRSSVAENISDEKKVDQAAGKANQPGTPPPTVK